MNELYFLAMNIPEETKDVVYHASSKICGNMSESERQAYYLGIENTVAAMQGILDSSDGFIVVNNIEFEDPRELDLDELTTLFCEDYE